MGGWDNGAVGGRLLWQPAESFRKERWMGRGEIMGHGSVRCEAAQEGVCDDSATTLAILL